MKSKTLVVTVTCDKCEDFTEDFYLTGEELSESLPVQEEILKTQLLEAGWGVTGEAHFCPACIEENTNSTSETSDLLN